MRVKQVFFPPISGMSYRTRESLYRQEKEELFYRMKNMTQPEIEEENRRLVRKYKI